MAWNPYGSYTQAAQAEDAYGDLSYDAYRGSETESSVNLDSRPIRYAREGMDPWDSLHPVPSLIASSQTWAIQHNDRDEQEEINNLRYTAVVDDANDFTLKNGYDLRARSFNRHTELMVGITYYNEEKSLLCRSLHSTITACRRIQTLKRHDFWNKGGPAWQKLVICITIDGLRSADRGALDVLAAIGAYRHGLLRETVNGKPVRAHVFEYTTELSVTEDLKIGGLKQSQFANCTNPSPGPVQFIVIIKNENCGKLNSYRWLYNSVSRILNPEVVVHLDTGTKIEPNGLIAVWNKFYYDRDLGGYKIGFQLDRTFESATGYLALLPGAFSAWRFRGQSGKPLEDTLLGDPTSMQTKSSQRPWNLNRYLADDRVICFQVVSKAGQKWHLEYDSSIVAKTDIPTSAIDFISQRRRWLNGAFFSTIYVVTHWGRMYHSGHNIIRLAAFHLQLFHNILALILAWFSLAAFLLTTFTINDIAGDPPEGKPISGFPFGKATPTVNAILQIVYLAMILFQFILALGSRPKNHVVGYTVSFLMFGFIQVYMMMNLIYLTKRLVDFKLENDNGSNYAYINEYFTDLGPATIITAGVSIFGVYIAVGFLALDPWHLFTSYAQFLFVSSSYVNILNIFAFSNVHDVSWGNKSKRQELPTQEPSRNYLLLAETRNRVSGASDTTLHEDIHIINAEYEKVVIQALTPDPVVKMEKQPSQSDSLLEFRTILLASYIFSNFFLCLIILNDSLKPLSFLGSSYWHKIRFFQFWLWANSISFLLRFAGSVYYYFMRYRNKLFRRRY
ncbi:hypothetical protein CEP52_007463 [Fusarium oligoseptatum]|uniref:Chitin synthase n=1 Tax=Fusarium oligoseptatum TaxID=2604345 RepID=A0A428TMT2_9HYPO|nr:hypothetical protein CEP52_007463 [Fusarium oligoseptatum]